MAFFSDSLGWTRGRFRGPFITLSNNKIVDVGTIPPSRISELAEIVNQ